MNFEGMAKKSVLKISPYVPGKPIEEVEREFGIKDVAKLASNENPLGPSRAAVKAASKKLSEVNLYPESSVYYLRQALSKKLRVRPEMLIFGNGSNELEHLLAEAFVSPGDEVMFSALSFVVYPIATNVAGGTEIQIPHKEFRHDIDGFINRLSESTKLIFICNPNNPTGTIITRAELEKFFDAALKLKQPPIVALDEAYFEYVRDKDYPDGLDYLSRYPALIVLRTFSKIHGLAGLRIGYGIADPGIVALLERVRPPFNVNLAAQAAGEAALADTAHVKKTLALNEEAKKFLYAGLKELGVEFVPTNANFIFVKFRSNSKVVFEELLKHGVIIRPVFDSFARITTGTMKQNKKLIKALGKVLK